MTWLDFGSQRSKVKVTAGRGEGIHVDAGGVEVHLLVSICCRSESASERGQSPRMRRGVCRCPGGVVFNYR